MRRLFGILLISVVTGATGCNLNPFCLNCGEPPDGFSPDGPLPDGGEGPDSAGLDGGTDLPDLTAVCNTDLLSQDPNNCGGCGIKCDTFANAEGLCINSACTQGQCQPGFYDLNGNASDGCEYACIPSVPSDEACDGVDNDCDGQRDEGFDVTQDPLNCGQCGAACTFPNATARCVNSTCQFTAATDCSPGFRDLDGVQSNGCEYGCPVFPTQAETCNGRDDDCNGQIDDSPGDVGQSCTGSCPAPNPCVAQGTCQRPSTCTNNNTCCGVCRPGSTICVGGAPFCQTSTTPGGEQCNNVDDNCDGQIDEGFNLQTDPSNCGSCGTVCNLNNAFPSCVNGTCGILACRPGFGNADGNTANGCEYTCPVNPVTAESCDGRDNDCNGIVDDPGGLVVPPNFCNQNTSCAGTQPVCRGAQGWSCPYGPNVEVDTNGNLVLAERRCDGRDGNCNTQVDESFPNLGQNCTTGIGRCQGTAPIRCRSDETGTECPASANANNAADEICNGIDDNCDGQVDERTPVAGTQCYNGGQHNCLGYVDPMVRVTATLPGGPATYWIYQYEASRPDATGSATGVDRSRACSKAGVLPWSQVNFQTASAACAAIRDSTGAAMRLCTAEEWTATCNLGTANQSVWSYASTPTTYNAATCNGYGNTAGNGRSWAAGTGPNCYANTANGRVYDMSGNVGEWTSTQVTVQGNTYYRIRGGAYGNFSEGTNCNFDFTIEQAAYQFEDLGFRCCSNNAP